MADAFKYGNYGTVCMKEVTLGLPVCIKWEATLTYYFFICVAGAWAGEWPSLLKCNMTCPARPLAGRRGGQWNQEAGQLFLETYCLQIRIAVKVTTYLWEGLWELHSSPFQALPKGYETANGCLLTVQGLECVFSMWGNSTRVLPFLQPLAEEAASGIPLIALWGPSTGPM